MAQGWRLVRSPAATGAENMAVDEAILESVTAGASPPTLRLYAWEPPCVSLGHAQPTSDLDLERLAALGWQWVRRPTGGRAILHTNELTYSVAARATDPLVAGGVLPSYRRLSQGLASALLRLGLQVEVQPGMPASGDRSNPVCFEVPGAYEITIGGKKLIGSAQVRRGGGILQHGTLPLEGDISRICLALRYRDETERAEAAKHVLERATTVEAWLGMRIAWDRAADAVVEGFSTTLDIELTPSSLTAEERRRVQALIAERYAQPDWAGRH